MASVEQAILHYQRDIEKICTRPERVLKYEDRLLHCLAKLNKLRVTVKHLQDTGIGKTVNSLRKYEGEKGLSDAAKALVAKWKNMVIEEDDAEEKNAEEEEKAREEDAKRLKLMVAKSNEREYSPENTSGCEYDYQPSTSSKQANNAYSPESISYLPHTEVKEYSPSKKSHTPNGYSPGSPTSNGIQVYCYSPCKKPEKTGNDNFKKDTKKSDKYKKDLGGSHKSSGEKSHSKIEKDASQKHSSKDKSYSSSSKSHSSSSNTKSSSSSSSSKAKSHHKSNNDDDIVSSKAKSHKKSNDNDGIKSSKAMSLKKHDKDIDDDNKAKSCKKSDDDGIDFMSGASFADALGPMIVKKNSSSPMKKSKSNKTDEKSNGGSRSSLGKRDSQGNKISASGKSSSYHQTSSSMSHKEISSTKSKSHEHKPSSSSSSRPVERKARALSPPPASTLLDDVAGPSHLAPLDMDMVSTLSVPTPNYRPTPQIPLTTQERRQRIQDEEDALARIMSNKNKNSRTKVYSGVKGGLTYVPTLYEICCNVLKQHIDALEFTGGIPYDILKPILDGATPSQLYQFENYNPYVIGDTEHLWKFHVNKEFRGETREEMESWRDMYLRCLDEREEKYKAVTANIQQSIKKSVPVRQTKLAYVDVAKPPRNILRKQMKNGTSRPDVDKLMGKEESGGVTVKPPGRVASQFERPRVNPVFKPKVAPLMQKTLKSIKLIRYKR